MRREDRTEEDDFDDSDDERFYDLEPDDRDSDYDND